MCILQVATQLCFTGMVFTSGYYEFVLFESCFRDAVEFRPNGDIVKHCVEWYCIGVMRKHSSSARVGTNSEVRLSVSRTASTIGEATILDHCCS